jgi:hypothetical protein
MSHTVILEIKFKSRKALEKACKRVGVEILGERDVSFYGSTHHGLAIQLPGWRYPIVVEGGGKVAYDNYDGQWGDTKELNKLSAYYLAEETKETLEGTQYLVQEIETEEGLELVITDSWAGGAA